MRTHRNTWTQVHYRRFWFCHNYFLLFLFLHPLRHRGAADQGGILSAASGAEMVDVEQMKKIVPFVTVKLFLVKMSASWCLVSMCRIWMFESRLILSNNQSKATLWVLDTCRIVGLLPLIITSSKTYNIALEPVCTKVINISQIEIVLLRWNLISHVERCALQQVYLQLYKISGFVSLVWWGMKYFNHEVPNIKSGNPIHA